MGDVLLSLMVSIRILVPDGIRYPSIRFSIAVASAKVNPITKSCQSGRSSSRNVSIDVQIGGLVRKISRYILWRKVSSRRA